MSVLKLCSTHSFWSTLDVSTILLGTIAILTALLSWRLGIIELRDKRRKILGLKASDWKKYALFIALVLAIATVMVQTQNQVQEKIESIEKGQKQDSIQRSNVNRTLRAIEKTLELQKVTLGILKLSWPANR
jgi:uncharacterized protein YlxW (UPF0749 family)